MSDLQRSFAKAKLSNLPFTPPVPLNDLGHSFDVFDETEEDEDQDHLKPLPSPNGLPEDDSSSASSASSVSSAGTIIPSPSQRLFARGKGPPSTSRFAPLPWTDFFAQEISVTPDHPARITHHIYLTPPSSQNGPLFVMHHGAGSSALSFAAVTGHILRQLPTAGVLAIDARGHGETHVGAPELAASSTTPTSSTSGAPVLDLSLTALSGDLERAYDAARQHMGWSVDLPVILVGHSLGGAVVATVAKQGRLAARLLGFAVFDVVEGSAMDALQSMQGYLATRPRSFSSVDEGIEWHLRSRTVRTAVSARASVPALLKPEIQLPTFPRQGSFGMLGGRGGVVHAGEPSAGSPASSASKSSLAPPPPPPPPRWPGRRRSQSADSDSNMADGTNGAAFDDNSDNSNSSATDDDNDDAARQRWTWRTDLAATQPFWEDWFVGLSAKFLTARGAKLLLLAGTDRLDKELMIGQMQGKYQLQVFPEAGHFVHEDAPDKTATVLVDFWRRNDGSRLVLPPKVSELLAKGQRV